MAAMVAAAAMADEPTADEMSIAVSGSEQLTWGVDLDDGKTGFKNEASAKVEVTFAKAGTKSTEGEGVWAELGVKVDGDVKYKSEKNETGGFDGGKVSVDVAKLHIGDLYIGLKDGGIQTGELKLPSAVFADSKDARLGLSNVGQKDVSQGLVAGYGTDDFGIAVDFRSTPNAAFGSSGTIKKVYEIKEISSGYVWWEVADDKGTTIATFDDDSDPSTDEIPYVTKGTAAKGYVILRTEEWGGTGATGTDYYNNHYGLKAEVELKDTNAFVPGLGVKAGVSYAFEEKNLGISASAGYKLGISDDLYVKPTVAFAGSKLGDGDFGGNIGASVVFGWGDQADANPGVYYLDSDDETKKVIPGVSVAMIMPVADGVTGKKFEIVPAFYSGDIVPGLKAAVLGDINIIKDTDPTFGVAAGVSYELAVGDSIKVTPKAGFRFANVDGGTSLPAISKKNTDNGAYTDVAAADKSSDAANKGLLNFKAGVDISGLIENTTFGAYYQSRNLKAAKKAGTFNVFVKVSL
ncbi:MAG: hypothetical protein J5857_06980 [Treponema sp.]|nr:hypothetical protein [Treponema sp.]